ncbi:glycosyltransferase family 2 protein [Undibacterium sp. TJN25]|uniref:glycosyltransferase family 2 protein n=1 Tax=Undibacterium sp. TJN25 TaxID=3413056 RepID=UPI003BF1CE57
MELAQDTSTEMIHAFPPLCSVCIANYNGIAFIDACIKSVLAQDCSFPVEIIIHDDASTDNSVEHIRKNYPGIVLITSAENVGFCISNNRMVDIAKGRYILLLNNDAELFPDGLSTLHAAAESLGKPAILGLPQYDADTNELIDIGSRFDLFLNSIPNRDRDEPQIGMIIGACLWLSRSLWDELGGFPDWFESLAEDMYLCCLARFYGHTVKALPDSGFRHWVGKSLGGGKVFNNRLTTKLSRRVLSERNKTFVMTLTYPAPVFQLIFPIHLALLLMEGMILAMLKGKPSLYKDIYWACIKAQWVERKRLQQLRQKIQARPHIDMNKFLSVFDLMPYKLSMLWRYGFPEVR